jgi:hypothetical protein
MHLHIHYTPPLVAICIQILSHIGIGNVDFHVFKFLQCALLIGSIWDFRLSI